MNSIPKVINTVVNNDLCVGCGLCVYKCPENAITMEWNEFGFLIPQISGNCNLTGDCIDVCPFNPIPHQKIKTENKLAQIFFPKTPNYHIKIGSYYQIYSGYSREFRLTSSSGGITTYILIKLIEKKIIDHVFSIKESEMPGVHYVYTICSNKQELLETSKTRYFPVSLGNVMTNINALEGRIAIVGVACFIKAIRLAQYKDSRLKEKIPFLAGIICGGLKSRYFTEYLSDKAGASKQYKKPQYRIKNLDSTAGDYSYGCYDIKTEQIKTVRMKSLVDMWGTGLFKANACDFCEDVTTELADISMGDAWISPYHLDGKGTNLVVTRTELAEKLIFDGIEKNELFLEKLDLKKFLSSQKGAYNHKHNGLPYRIKKAKSQNLIIPPKRFGKKKVPFDFKIVQLLRMKIRKKSIEEWNKNPNAEIFDQKMNMYIKLLKFATAFYHHKTLIINKLTK